MRYNYAYCRGYRKGSTTNNSYTINKPGEQRVNCAKRKNYPVTCILLGMPFGSGVVFDLNRRQSVRSTIHKLQVKYKSEGLRWTYRTIPDRNEINVFRIG